jgi:DNA-binding CsgD family transcriptional regulator
MNTSLSEGCWGLTEKEKQTLRLIVRGHDAKSSARSLGVSVHTINERLRDARRKMTVSSSREAARMLLDAEGGDAGPSDPNVLGDEGFRADAARHRVNEGTAPNSGVRRVHRQSWIIGVCLMTLALGLIALAALPQVASTPSAPPAVSREAPNAAVVDTARRWLTLVDQARWDESYRATGASFRQMNTLAMWTAASEKARAPLGAVVSRTFASQESLPAPPNGYEVVKFRTRFANKDDVVETVSLAYEDGTWRIAGVYIG